MDRFGKKRRRKSVIRAFAQYLKDDFKFEMSVEATAENIEPETSTFVDRKEKYVEVTVLLSNV